MSTMRGRGEDRTYFDGLSRGELVYQRCRGDGATVFPLRVLCPECGSEDLDLRISSGVGTVYSFTTQFRASAAFADRVPITFVLVDLDEGFRAFATLTDATSRDVAIGQRVVAGFEDVDDDLTVLRFSRTVEGARV